MTDREFKTLVAGLTPNQLKGVMEGVKILREPPKALVERNKLCDICHQSLFSGTWFFDGATKMGPWAWMCYNCFPDSGVGLGMGKGQCYDSQTLVKQTMV